ncbi:MAG: inositol-3-phosphate synthase, partial [Candidatus Bathyarchaeota archaeon]
MPKIKVALAGVGNCTSALVQGLYYYSHLTKETVGLRNPQLGGLSPSDIQVVAAFDIDNRKVGKDLAEAIFAKPNNAPKITDIPSTNIIVNKGPVLDGIGKGTKNIVRLSNTPYSEIAEILKQTDAEIMINLLPSGATN